MEDRSGRIWDALSGILFLGALAAVAATFRDYGVTWDEDVHNQYGILVLDYYLSLFKDRRCLDWLDLYNYGAAFDMVAAALNRISDLGVYETRHLLNGLVGLLGVAGCWKLGRSLGGPRAGFLAALLLLAIPNWYGQSFNNPKDIPFAAGMVWSAYYLVRLIPVLPRPPLSLAVRLGVASGMAMGVRIGGLLALCYLGLLLTLFVLWRAAELRSPRLLAADAWAAFCRAAVPAGGVAFLVMLLFWPWAQQDPIRHPLAALSNFSQEIFPYPTLFAGKYYPAADLPWDYLPTFILLALPELHLLLLAAGPLAAWAGFRALPPARRRERVLAHFMVAFCIVFPVAYAIAIQAVLFDGMRHFIFVLPPIAALAAAIGNRLLGRLARLPGRRAGYAALGLYGAWHASVMVRLHPDQYVYYNSLVGGVEGAQGLYKLDYWGNSYREAVRGLIGHLKAEYGADFANRRFSVAVCGPPVSAAYFFPENFEFARDREKADFFIAFTKDDCHKSLPGREIVRVERMNALLSVVLDRRSPQEPGR